MLSFAPFKHYPYRQVMLYFHYRAGVIMERVGGVITPPLMNQPLLITKHLYSCHHVMRVHQCSFSLHYCFPPTPLTPQHTLALLLVLPRSSLCSFLRHCTCFTCPYISGNLRSHVHVSVYSYLHGVGSLNISRICNYHQGSLLFVRCFGRTGYRCA